MPPLFRPHRPGLQIKALLSRRWPQLMLTCLLAMATGITLAASTGKRPAGSGVFLTPVLSQPQGSSLRRLLSRRPSQPLTVPPWVLPQPLPPTQAWPDLPVVQAEPSFTDLDRGHWAWPLLADLAQRDLVAGFPDSSFRPAESMTRAEFAAQVARLFDFPQDRSQAPAKNLYDDLAPTHWAYGSVQKSVQMGFLSGYADGVFLPDQTVSRIQVIAALANGLMLKSSSSTAAVLTPYSDRAQVPPWATRQLVAATEAGLVVNYPDLDTLAPNQPASRAEVATMLHRALVYTGSLQEVPFAYVVGQTAAQ